MNIELLKKVKRRILREPSQFRMDVWSCGTAHCIAGTACVLSGVTLNTEGDPRWDVHGDYTVNGQLTSEVAARLLRVRGAEKEDRLFMVNGWPMEFMKRYQKARTRKQRAQIAAERIDHFIATNGRE